MFDCTTKSSFHFFSGEKIQLSFWPKGTKRYFNEWVHRAL